MNETERNREIMQDFARLFYAEKNVQAAFERYVAADYVQHNPGIPDGREAAVQKLTPMFSDPHTSFEVKRLLVDGQHAVIHLHARKNAQERGGAVCDLYRLENGVIVEHWDVMQPIPAEAANDHPMF